MLPPRRSCGGILDTVTPGSLHVRASLRIWCPGAYTRVFASEEVAHILVSSLSLCGVAVCVDLRHPGVQRPRRHPQGHASHRCTGMDCAGGPGIWHSSQLPPCNSPGLPEPRPHSLPISGGRGSLTPIFMQKKEGKDMY